MTSNLGTEYIRKGGALGFLADNDDSPEVKDSQEKIEKALKEAFRPEFLNRIDDIITFASLSKDDVAKIVDLQVNEIYGRLSNYGVRLVIDESARRWLAEQGYDPMMGARPLQRTLQKFVESKLAIKLLEGEFKAGDVVRVSKEDEKSELVFTLDHSGDASVPMEEIAQDEQA